MNMPKYSATLITGPRSSGKTFVGTAIQSSIERAGGSCMVIELDAVELLDVALPDVFRKRIQAKQKAEGEFFLVLIATNPDLIALKALCNDFSFGITRFISTKWEKQ